MNNKVKDIRGETTYKKYPGRIPIGGPTRAHKDKSKYNRKRKHKKNYEKE